MAHCASQVQGTPSVQTLTPSWTQHEFWMSCTRACSSASLFEQTPFAKCESARASLHTPAKAPKAGMSKAKEAALRAAMNSPHSSLNGTSTSAQAEPQVVGKPDEQSSSPKLSQHTAVMP